MRYSDELLDEIRSRNDIIDVVSQYVTLKRSGRNYFGLCPFHNEKSPSFSVSPDKQIFHCFGCGVGGNVFHFIQKIENVSFVESVQMLADRAGIKLPTLTNYEDEKVAKLKAKVYDVNKFTAEFYHKNLYRPESKQGQEYIKKRKLDNNTLKSFMIGYSGQFDELYRALRKEGFEDEEILSLKPFIISPANPDHLSLFMPPFEEFVNHLRRSSLQLVIVFFKLEYLFLIPSLNPVTILSPTDFKLTLRPSERFIVPPDSAFFPRSSRNLT